MIIAKQRETGNDTTGVACKSLELSFVYSPFDRQNDESVCKTSDRNLL